MRQSVSSLKFFPEPRRKRASRRPVSRCQGVDISGAACQRSLFLRSSSTGNFIRMFTGIVAAIEAILDLAWRFLPIFRFSESVATARPGFQMSTALRVHRFPFPPRFHAHLPTSPAGEAPMRVVNCAYGPRALNYRFPPHY